MGKQRAARRLRRLPLPVRVLLGCAAAAVLSVLFGFVLGLARPRTPSELA